MGPNWGQDADGPRPSACLLPRLFLQGHNQGRLRLPGKRVQTSCAESQRLRQVSSWNPGKWNPEPLKKREPSGAQNYRALEFLFLEPGNKGAATTTLREDPHFLIWACSPHPIWLIHVICVLAESLTPHLH